MKLSVLQKIRIWYPLRTIKVPAWGEVIPEFQIPILCSTFCALLFYNFVQSPWYMNLVVFWATACIVFVAWFIHAFLFEGKKHAK